MELMIRHRRARMHAFARNMVRESALHPHDFIYPLFVQEDAGTVPIPTLPGISRRGGQDIIDHAEAAARGIQALALFPEVPGHKKTDDCQEAWNPDNLICRTLSELKAALPHIGLVCDVALDPYNPTGQDGYMNAKGLIDNDTTVAALVRQSLALATAGADVVAPSDMMDGRIGAIRQALEADGHINTLILAYAAKYASSLYGPFRDAVGSSGALKGDKKSYQMDPANYAEALREIGSDIDEGADWIMVKPGHTYLDIVRAAKDTFAMPTFAYHVSGEYAMWAFAAQAGAPDRAASIQEILLSFKRAGADGILTTQPLKLRKCFRPQIIPQIRGLLSFGITRYGAIGHNC